MYLDPSRVSYLLPHLSVVRRDGPQVYEVVVRYVGALQIYVTLPSGKEVTMDYFTDPSERPRCFDLSHLYLDSRGQIIDVLYHDPPD